MNTGSATPCRDLYDSLLAAADPLKELDLTLPGCRVQLRVDAPIVFAELADYFAEFISPRASAATPDLVITALSGETPPLPPSLTSKLTIKEDDKGRPPKEAWIDLADGRIVHKIRTGVVLIMGTGVDLIAGPIADHVDQAVNFVNHRLMQRWIAAGGVLAHAAGIARGDRGLILCGSAGAGKSTLALHMMAADPSLAFVSNDRAVLDRKTGDGSSEVRLLGIPKQPRVNPGTVLHNPSLASMIDDDERRRYAAMPVSELRFLEEKRDAMIPALFGPGRFLLEARALGLVILRWTPGGGPMRIQEVPLEGRPDLQAILHKRLGLFFWPLASPTDEAGMAALATVLAGVPAYEVSGGIDFDAATTWADELLGGSSTRPPS